MRPIVRLFLGCFIVAFPWPCGQKMAHERPHGCRPSWWSKLFESFAFCTYVCMCVRMYMYVPMYACMHVCMHACMYVCMYVCVYIFTYIHMVMEAHKCTYIHTHLYIHTHIHILRERSPHMQWIFLLGSALLAILVNTRDTYTACDVSRASIQTQGRQPAQQ